jgi:hypothetical protein
MWLEFIYIPLLTERGTKEPRAINMLLLRSKNVISLMTSFLTKLLTFGQHRALLDET